MITEEDNLPNNWKLKEIQNVAEVIPGNSPPGESYNERGKGIPFIQGAKAMGKNVPMTDRFTDNPTKVCETGDTILAVRATIGDLNEADKEYCIGRGVAAVRATDDVSQEYLHTYLQAVNRAEYWKEVSTGATFNSITKNDVKSLNIPVPPPEVQSQIVESVKERIDTIDTLARSISETKNLTSEYEDSLLAFILSGKKDMSEGAVGGIPTEDVVPDDWRLEDFGDVVDVNPRISKPDTDTFAHVPMDGVSAETQSIDYFSERDSVYSGLAKFEEGDIVFARITPCMENGKVAIVDELPEGRDMSFGSTELAVFRTKDDFSTEYIFNYVKSQFIREVAKDQMKGATGRERVPLDFFKKELKIPIPPEGQEDEVMEKLRNIRENVNKANHSIKMVDELFDEYRDSVLAHAFKGELLDIETENESANPNKNQNEGSRPEFDSGGQQSLEQIAGGKE